MKTNFNSSFARRTAISFFLMAVLFLSGVLRIAVITTKGYDEICAEQSRRRITVSGKRGTIYDRNMIPLTNRHSRLTAAVSPTPRAAMVIATLIEDRDELDRILAVLSEGKPAICEVPFDPECDGITVIGTLVHTSSDTPAVHTVGYTDSSGHGVSGLEAAYDDILYSDSTTDAVFTVNGIGKILEGEMPYFETVGTAPKGDVVSTLDINLQLITENACSALKKGAAVVCEVNSGKIRACLSKPTFDISDISSYLKSEDSPLLDRTLAAFSVGSVFKLCTAAAAIGAGLSDSFCECKGGVQIGNRFFNCHNRAGHGGMDMGSAVAFSCNSYFYELSVKLGAKRLYNMASSLNFGNPLRLADGFFTAKGSLPQISQLTTDASLANLGIGQGSLLLSPISLLPLYCAIATDGKYHIPSLVEGTVIDGELIPYSSGSPTRVFTNRTAEILREYLGSVITEGTGKEAQPTLTTAAGKTATAQTGQFRDNKEITNSWFCGFFPIEQPKYAVVVMSEGAADKSTASIFAEIADKITEYEAPKGNNSNP